MLYTKIILALFLSAIPFIFKYLILPKKESSETYRNVYGFIGTVKKVINKYRKKYFNISIKFYNALKQSKEARKFFSFVLLLALLTVIMIDFNASSSVARKVNKIAQESAYQTEKLIALYNDYRPYITFRYATLLAGLMVIPFFSFKATDRILVWLKGNRAFLMASMTIVLFLLYSAFFTAGRSMLIIELAYIILGASLLYPSIRHCRNRTTARAVSREVIDRIYNQRYLHKNSQ